MASVTKNMDENAMADDDSPRDSGSGTPRPPEVRDRRPPEWRPVTQPATEAKHGFFTVYKKGQGYWTRMGTAGTVALIGIMIGYFLYTYLPMWGVPARVMLGVVAGVMIGYGLLGFYLLNKPRNVDFLIATDSEMKKVNWTSRKELIGSTKVVIVFMFLIAAFLFVVDVFFGYFFQFIHVLKFGPFD